MQPADIAAQNRATRRPGAALSAAIQALHDAIAVEPDPQHKAVITQCLAALMKLQATMMQPPQQAVGRGAGGY